MSTPHELKRAISSYSTALHERGWVANHDGNVSARVGEGFLITPTGVSKRLCPPDSIVRCDAQGRPQSRGRPPSEVALHVGAYRDRPEVKAVMHAHPPHASAFALARKPLGPVAMPEIVVSLGAEIPLAPLVLPKDPAAVEVAASAVSLADAVLLTGNGVLTVGADLEQAYLRMELVEHYARIVAIAANIGGVVELEAPARDRMLQLRAKAGLGPKDIKGASAPSNDGGGFSRTIRPIVAEEVRRVLEGGKR